MEGTNEQTGNYACLQLINITSDVSIDLEISWLKPQRLTATYQEMHSDKIKENGHIGRGESLLRSLRTVNARSTTMKSIDYEVKAKNCL